MEWFDRLWKVVVWAAGAMASLAFGGMSGVLTWLLLLIAADYATGVIASAIEAREGKGPGLSSAVGMKGLAKKVFILVMVAVAYRADVALGDVIDLSVLGIPFDPGPTILRDATAFFYCANELLSLIENGGRIGVPFPSWMTTLVAALRGERVKGV